MYMHVLMVVQANGQRDTNPGSVLICTRIRIVMRASSFEIACTARGFLYMQMVIRQRGHGKKIRGSDTTLINSCNIVFGFGVHFFH
jgi:hypothetical protein